MEAKNFRPNNLIKSGLGIYKIYALSIPQILAIQEYTEPLESQEKVYATDGTIIKPININEEWLLKLGFIKDPKLKGMYWHEKKERTYVHIESPISIHFGNKLGSLKMVDYVHELQNLFFAITETELELKTKVSACG